MCWCAVKKLLTHSLTQKHYLGVVGNYSICWLLTFSVTCVPNIMKIRQCFLELQLKMSGMFFLRHTVHHWPPQHSFARTQLRGSRKSHLATSHNRATPRSCRNLFSQLYECKRTQLITSVLQTCAQPSIATPKAFAACIKGRPDTVM